MRTGPAWAADTWVWGGPGIGPVVARAVASAQGCCRDMTERAGQLARGSLHHGSRSSGRGCPVHVLGACFPDPARQRRPHGTAVRLHR